MASTTTHGPRRRAVLGRRLIRVQRATDRRTLSQAVVGWAALITGILEMHSIDYAHLKHAVMEVYSVAWTCDSAAVYFAKSDMPDPLRPALTCREKLAAVYMHLAAAINLAEPYERIGPNVLSEIDAQAAKRDMYSPADKWAGRFSATSAAVDCLKGFVFLARCSGWRPDELDRIREEFTRWDQSDCWENHGILQSSIDEVAEVMRRWQKRYPLEWRLLNRVVEIEGQLFGSSSYEDNPEWRWAELFLEAAAELGADQEPFASSIIWARAGVKVGDVDEENADISDQKAKDILQWLGKGTQRIKGFNQGLQFLKPGGRKGYRLTKSGSSKAEAIGSRFPAP
jgi:hypothetical protein